MTAHDPRIARTAAKLLQARPARHPLGSLDVEQLSGRLVVFTPAGMQIDGLMNAARKAIGRLAANEAVHRVVSHNPDSFWAIARRGRYKSSLPIGEGFVAYLMLNHRGLKGLLDGSLNAGDPDLSMIAKRDVDVYARAATPYGLQLMQTMGFEPGAEFAGVSHPNVHVYRRSEPAAEAIPIYDNYRKQSTERGLSVTVARSLDDIMRVMSIRSAVYVAGQECPYHEEFDGNDFSATHLLGYVGDEPAGGLRVRYFANFAKIERLAVRQEFRCLGLGSQLVNAAVELCRVKGYQLIYAHSQKRLLEFWSQFAFRPLKNGREFVFSDFDYVEIVLDTTPHPQAISIGVDPYVMIRPEGRWHVPGILERSAIRPVTRPSVETPSQRARA